MNAQYNACQMQPSYLVIYLFLITLDCKKHIFPFHNHLFTFIMSTALGNAWHDDSDLDNNMVVALTFEGQSRVLPKQV